MLRSILFILLTAAIGNTWSQAYYFTKFTGGNPPHAASGVVPNNQRDDAATNDGGAWNLLMGASEVAAYSKTTLLPFAFQFAGSNVVACKVSNSGYLTFDTTVSGSPLVPTTLLPSANLPAKTVYFGGIIGSEENDQVLTRVFGTAPHRQLWIKFASFSSIVDTLGLGTYNYVSIVLEESTNKIHLVFMQQGQANGEIAEPIMNPGIQVTSSNAVAINNSTTTSYDFLSGRTNADNIYYTFTYGNQPNYDLELSLVEATSSVKTGNLTSIKYSLTNNGSANVDSTTVYYSVNGGAVQQSKVYPALQGNRANSYEKVLTGLTVLGAPGTLYTIKLWVSEANNVQETIRENDSVEHILVAVNGNSAAKRILLESGTAAWCNTCPVVNRQLEALQERYKDTLIVVQHHQLDEMAGNNDSLFDTYYNNLPEIMLNRRSWEGQNSTKSTSVDSAAVFIAKIQNDPASVPAIIEVANVQLSESTGVFTYEVRAIFKDYYYGEINIGGMVLEDNVRGVGGGFSQSIKSALRDDITDWFYKFSDPIIGYYHNHVAWNMGGSTWGKSMGSKLYKQGDTATATFAYTFPELLKKTNIPASPYLPVGEVLSLGKPADMKAVGYLAVPNKGDRNIVNADMELLWNASLKNSSVQAENVRVYPVPSGDKLFVAAPASLYQVQVFSASGRLVSQFIRDNRNAALMEISLRDLEIQAGIYWIKMTDAKGVQLTHRVVYTP